MLPLFRQEVVKLFQHLFKLLRAADNVFVLKEALREEGDRGHHPFVNTAAAIGNLMAVKLRELGAADVEPRFVTGAFDADVRAAVVVLDFEVSGVVFHVNG